MTEEETVKAIATGIKLVQECKRDGYTLLATGEMGIGNTTTSSAVAAAVLRCDPILVTGKGAGLSEEGLLRKQQLIAEAIRSYDLYAADPFTVLSTVGGFDIAGLVGMCVGGALFHLPIVLDGVISMVAALVANAFSGDQGVSAPLTQGKGTGRRVTDEGAADGAGDRWENGTGRRNGSGHALCTAGYGAAVV